MRGRDNSEMKCVEIRYWGGKALVSARHPLDQDSKTRSENTPLHPPTDAQCCPYPLGTASKPIKWGRKSIPTPALPSTLPPNSSASALLDLCAAQPFNVHIGSAIEQEPAQMTGRVGLVASSRLRPIPSLGCPLSSQKGGAG